MTPQNGATPRHFDGLDSLGASFRMIGEAMPRPAPAEPPRAPGRGWMDTVTRAIQDRPLTAAAIALGLGFLASRLVRG